MYFATEVENTKNVRSCRSGSPERSANTNARSLAAEVCVSSTKRRGEDCRSANEPCENAGVAAKPITTCMHANSKLLTTCFSFGGSVRYNQYTTPLKASIV